MCYDEDDIYKILPEYLYMSAGTPTCINVYVYKFDSDAYRL